MAADTIFALSSGPPPSGVAVVRISGPAAREALMAMTGKPLQESRRLTRHTFRHPETGNALDDGLATWFPGPGSATGEDVAELHLHGGRAVIAGVLDALGTLERCRPAEAGEFSRRAFDNGKLDLAEVEGLADLISAETEAQRRQAFRQLSGAMGEASARWREDLKGALALMQADIDFSDEDLPESLSAEARDRIAGVRDEIARHLGDERRGERLRDGIRIAIVGPPNAGKSSLMNHLARRDVAIVSEHAGTTRDVIEAHLDLGGYPVTVADTAGLRESADDVEREGVRRAEAWAREAELRVLVLDGAAWPEVDAASMRLAGDDTLIVVSKADLETVDGDAKLDGRRVTAISVTTGTGVEEFLSVLEERVARSVGGEEPALITRARHRAALTACAEHLGRALETRGAELWAEDLRLGMRELGRMVGDVGVEEVLDVIFRDFCIGK